ncbi:MAG: hypothetical protein GY865_03900 [candidate division Zixibacteria bacterium]|nr:hypothetical protein [candidate division Zixibacteria bacterium]
MKNKKSILAIIGLIVLCLVAVGCKDILVSGTFIFVEDFDFTAETGFYFAQFDITLDDDWIEHKDKIDFVDAVGLEFDFTNNESIDVTFNAYVAVHSGPGLTPPPRPGTAIHIIQDLTVAPGTTHISYKESLAFIAGVEEFKALVKTGKFDYYGYSTTNDGTDFVIEEGTVIATISASE